MHIDDIAKFWERLGGITAGFLATQDGATRMVPMSHQLRDGDSTIWFITARDTDLAEASEHGSVAAAYVIAEGGKGLYAIIEGELFHNNDAALRDELWSLVADTLFDGGKTDPKVCILGLSPNSAEIWLTPTSGARFLFNIAKAKLTDEQAELGSHGTASQAELTRATAAE
jgi:general stress protein 26